MTGLRLESVWHGDGTLALELFDLAGIGLGEDFRLGWTGELRMDGGDPVLENATLVRSFAGFHEYAWNNGRIHPEYGRYSISIRGFRNAPTRRARGPKSAWVTLADGTVLPVAAGDLLRAGNAPPSPAEGVSAALIPWPQSVEIKSFSTAPVTLCPAPGAAPDDLAAMHEAAALARRLFPAGQDPFALVPVGGAVALRFVADAGLGGEGYRLSFGEDGIILDHGDAAGRLYGLVSLAQMLRAARRDPSRFGFPESGQIVDSPRFSWRACHLDVSRQFYPPAQVSRFLDILAWHKLNTLHWHLGDDEGWRLAIDAYPQLTEIASKRGADEALPPLLGSGAESHGGHYSKAEVRALVAHAGTLGITVMPEIDIPGHCTAMLAALPRLRDPDEPESYWSIQGYPNNALNPAVEETYEVLAKIFDEMVELFPAPVLHVGGDEVDERSWLASPLAQALMARENLAGTAGLQGYFMRRVKALLAARGKVMGGWEEVAHGGGVERDGTLLFAWTKPEAAAALAAEGYDIVVMPATAYYLDMIEDESWHAPGTDWAGVTPPATTYAFEPLGAVAPEHRDRVRGVEGAIWSEHLTSAAIFNELVFPRLSAIAETAWSFGGAKDFGRFSAIAPLMPRL